MKIHFVTIALDAMPWITFHYPEFVKLNHLDWRWSVIEGVAEPVNDTAWCTRISARLSNDGTTDYLASLKDDPRVNVFQRRLWGGKLAMINEPLGKSDGEFLLWQIDSDEIWNADQIFRTHDMFASNPHKNCAYFWCNYFVGPDLKIKTRNAYGNHAEYEWHRVWKVNGNAIFKSHEPPRIAGFKEVPFLHAETEKLGLVFQHMAYATEKQVAFKQVYYGGKGNQKGHLYANAIENWRRLQKHRTFPANLRNFLPWVGNGAIVERVK